jgi:hypothetical protein
MVHCVYHASILAPLLGLTCASVTAALGFYALSSRDVGGLRRRRRLAAWTLLLLLPLVHLVVDVVEDIGFLSVVLSTNSSGPTDLFFRTLETIVPWCTWVKHVLRFVLVLVWFVLGFVGLMGSGN